MELSTVRYDVRFYIRVQDDDQTMFVAEMIVYGMRIGCHDGVE